MKLNTRRGPIYLLIWLFLLPVTSPLASVNHVIFEEKNIVLPYGTIFDLQVNGSYLYTLEQFNGLEIFDCSDMENIVKIGGFPTSYGHSVYIDSSNSKAYLLDPKIGLMILDIKDKTSPIEIGRYTDVSGTNFQIIGNKIYLGDEDNGLKIIDISNSSSPSLITSWIDIENGGHVGSVYAHNDYVFVNLRLPQLSGPPTPLALKILDISDIANISTVYTLLDETSDYDGGFVELLEDNLLYVNDYSNGLIIYNFTEPLNPILIGGYKDGGEANSFVKQDNLIFLANGLNGLTTLDISDMSNIKKVGSYSSGTYTARIDHKSESNLVFLGTVQGGVKIVSYTISTTRTSNGLTSSILVPTTTKKTTSKATIPTTEAAAGTFPGVLVILIVFISFSVFSPRRRDKT